MPELMESGRERPIRSDDQNKLRTLLGLRQEDELPEAVKDCYWQHVKLWQKLGYSTAAPDQLLVQVVVLSKVSPVEPVVPWVLREFDGDRLKRDAKIKVNIRGKERDARFILIAADRKVVRVHADGDGEERMVKVEEVVGAA